MSHSTRPRRTPQRQLSVSCEGPCRLAVGRRPATRPAMATLEAEPGIPWSRGLWGVFLPDRRRSAETPRVLPRSGQPERRRAA